MGSEGWADIDCPQCEGYLDSDIIISKTSPHYFKYIDDTMLCGAWICITVYAVCHGDMWDIVLQFTQQVSPTVPDGDCDGATYTWVRKTSFAGIGNEIDVSQYVGGSGVNCVVIGSPTPTVTFLAP
jgi:hypothetical protein